jgi:hypothetical protein
MDKKLIGEAIQALELIDIYLYTTSVKRFKEISSSNYPDEMAQQNKIAIGAEFLEAESERNTERLINAKVEFCARYIVEENDNEVTAYAEIEACFIAKYSQLKDISEEAISEFMKFNVVHNIWPFWREHAFRLSAQAKLPTPIISLYKPTSG